MRAVALFDHEEARLGWNGWVMQPAEPAGACFFLYPVERICISAASCSPSRPRPQCGSDSAQGAGGPVMRDAISRVTKARAPPHPTVAACWLLPPPPPLLL